MPFPLHGHRLWRGSLGWISTLPYWLRDLGQGTSLPGLGLLTLPGNADKNTYLRGLGQILNRVKM